MALHDTIQVSVDEGTETGPSDDIPSVPFQTCQLIPPCKEGYHVAQAPHDGTGPKVFPKKIGKYFFSEDALKHDLEALKRGKVYTKREFFRRARAWYKAEIDRILHWHKVYRENHPEDLKPEGDVDHKSDRVEASRKEATVDEDKEQQLPLKKESKDEKQKTEGPIKEEAQGQQETRPTEDPKPTPRRKKEKVTVAPTRVQPSRAAKRKPVEPSAPPKATRKKKKKTEPPPKVEKPIQEEPHQPAQATELNQAKQQEPNPSEQEPRPETKGDYELSLDEWKLFLTTYNNNNNNNNYNNPTTPSLAFPPPTPIPPTTNLSTFSQTHLQGIDAATFTMRLEAAVESKINDLIADRQGITIDTAGGGLCLTGYYHHPFRCALDGNYVPPKRFEPAGAYAPGEDWRPVVAGQGVGDGGGGKKEQVVNVVSPTRYRPPGGGKQASIVKGGVASPTTATTAGTAGTAGSRQVDSGPAVVQPSANSNTNTSTAVEKTPEKKPSPPSWSIREANSMHQRIGASTPPPDIDTASARDSPAPEAAMDISPTLGRWKVVADPTALPVEDFGEAIVDVAGLRFAVDLCAGYMGDGRGARVFML